MSRKEGYSWYGWLGRFTRVGLPKLKVIISYYWVRILESVPVG